jgi:hypothetical protein
VVTPEREKILESFEAIKLEFIQFFWAHSDCPFQEFVSGLGWPSEKVEILLNALIGMKMAVPWEGPKGETLYHFVEFKYALPRKLAQEAARLKAPAQVKGPEKDYIDLLCEKGYL